ncbi:glycosyltransferase [Antarcticibacterium arcticum]|uniref:Glycosyltransferase n=1 Tax=Antarcticibacterium arcticum TaxID=2585771 RepID=A0A5B8YIG2_9FLAO|nr:glycosyltransferase [Antarcticibacterium arcticum]QED37740.1 glycosyltransferase [Antarcticibacterium arcticum]
MRVLQLIDSLRPGGAEKMAVNIANALVPHVEGSFLCCTRQEGMLKDELKPEVGYLYLNKKSSLDPNAILKLRKYIRKNKIVIVHAHSTSFFLAGLLKLSGCKFKLIWHDHYGENENQEAREYKVLKRFSVLFAGIISVNTSLKEWANKNLDCKKVIEIKNFIPEPDPTPTAKITLRGNADDFKIICVANIRPQKDHLNLLRAFEMLKPALGITLHLVGEDPGTAYSKSVFKVIENSPLKEKIFYYGTQQKIISLLEQADLGVLSSRSEGLPLALLEYGMAGLPVICTSVGKCKNIISNRGLVIPSKDSSALAIGIRIYTEDNNLCKKNGLLLQNYVSNNYSAEIVITQVIQMYKFV